MALSMIETAERFATERHAGQIYDNGRPYIVHPRQVAALLNITAPLDENLIAAGWLHDTIEDTATTYDELKALFGQDVADLVHEVTHEGQADNHGYYFPRLRTHRGIMLKFADRLSNLSNILVWDEKRQEQYLRRSKFWKSEGSA